MDKLNLASLFTSESSVSLSLNFSFRKVKNGIVLNVYSSAGTTEYVFNVTTLEELILEIQSALPEIADLFE